MICDRYGYSITLHSTRHNFSNMRFLLTTLIFLGSCIFHANAQEPMPLLVGSEAPRIEGTDHGDEAYSLSKSLESGPVVVVFYRGEWCSYCNRHMAALQEAFPEFQELGASLVAITPELPRYVQKTIKKSGASFSIVSDTDHKIMDRWNVSFTLDEFMYERYKAFGIKIDRASGNKDRVLPVPATYIVGKDGKIEVVHFNKDYTERMPVSEILIELERLR